MVVKIAKGHQTRLNTVTHIRALLMVIGLHGDSTADVPRAVVEVHSIEREPAITHHLPAVANIVLDQLIRQTRAIPKGVLLMVIGGPGVYSGSVPRLAEVV